ncbi:MAG: c-type cytochrome [Pseudomonadota bacterium]
MRSRIKRLAGVAILGLAVSGAAVAQEQVAPDLSEPISLRMNIMKQVGASMEAMGKMAKGETPFEERVAVAAMRTMRAGALGYAAQFPEGSDTGMETEASPKIWEDRAGFEEAVAEFIADTGAALEMPPTNVEELKQAMGELGENCKGCHEDYRIKKD